MFVKSHNWLRCVLTALVLMSALIAPNVPAAQAADGWTGTQRITGNQIGIFPDIVTDSDGVSHVVYTETPDFNSARIVRYMNNRGGQWSSPVTLSSSGLFADLGRLSTINVGGKVYLALVYKGRVGNNTNSRIYFRLSTDGGVTWSPQEQISNATSFEPAVSLDPSGQPHVVFTYQPGSELTLAYITKVGGSWTAPVVLSPSGNGFNRDTTIGYTVSGGTLTLHVLFSGGTNGDESSKRIWYTRKIGGGAWDPAVQRQSTAGGGFPKLVTDAASSIYGAWHVNSSAYSYEPYFSRSTDNGGSWKNPQAVGSLTSDIGQTPAIARTPSGKLAVLWEDSYNTSDNRRDVYARTSDNNGDTWSSVQNISAASGFSRNVAAAGGPAGFRAVWHDDRSGSYQIYTSAYAAAGPALSAQPSIENGAAVTKNNPVSVSFSAVSGSPKEIRWRWGAAPTDAANDSGGWQTYTNPKAIPLPSNPTLCGALTLYTQVKDGATIESSAKSDAIGFDNAVQATVKIVNPFLAGLPQTFTTIQDTSTKPSDGAYDGDPRYTRIPQFFLGIYNAGDCSNLSSFSVPASNVTGAITNGKYENKVALPQAAITNPGAPQTIGVSVVDGIGNLGNYSSDLIYDPADTDPSTTVTNTAGLPVLNSGSGSADSANSIIRTLSFSNVNVDDNVYGKNGENLPAGRQFWGVWIANATSDVGADNPNLQWYPIRVPAPNSSFSVKWNIFTGLNIGPDPSKTGTYFVYVRFLDGAGNASLATNAIKIQVTLTAGYSIPTLDLPFIVK